MKDVIVYEKQAAQLAKAVGKAQDALGEVFVVMSKLGIQPVGKAEKAPKAAKIAPVPEKVKGSKKAEKRTRTEPADFPEM